MVHEDLQVPLTDQVVRFPVDAECVGQRLDVFLAQRMPEFSRSFLQRAVYAGAVQVLGAEGTRKPRPNYKLRPGDLVVVQVPQPPPQAPLPEDIPLDVLYEDPWIIVINKPVGMVVHPACGHWSGTLVSALQHHFDRLSSLGGPVRPGIVHRLDRDTSGVMVVARTDVVHAKLAKQFSRRRVEKEYWALVHGQVEAQADVIELPIGRHPHNRKKMSTCPAALRPRNAETFYEVLERFERFTLLRVMPRTGRTHQIRVHLAAVGHPVLGDGLYGGLSPVQVRHLLPSHWLTPSGQLRSELQGQVLPTPLWHQLQGELEQVVLERQALHALRLKFLHPQSREVVQFTAPLADDFRRALHYLRMGNRQQPSAG